MLNEFKYMVQIDKDFENFGEMLQLKKEEMVFVGLLDVLDKDEDILFWKGFNFLMNLFFFLLFLIFYFIKY